MSAKPKHRLPLVLLTILQKRSALFLKKFVLSDDCSDSETSVIEYDHQCEGADIIVDFFKSKMQTTLLKAFTELKQLESGRTKVAFVKKPAINTTKRTWLNTTFSDNSPIRELNTYTVKSKLNHDTSRPETSLSNANAQKVDLANLLYRVKLTNSRAQLSTSFREQPKYSHNQSSTRDPNMTYNPYQQQQHGTPTSYSRLGHRDRIKTHQTNQTVSVYNQTTQSKKNSRRQFIMSKFNQIENTLHVMESSKARSRISSQIMGQINSIKQRLRL